MKFLLSIFIALVLGLTVNLERGFTSSHHDSESAQENGTGHCVYKADNPFADTYQACRTNITADACMGLAEEGDGMVTILDPEYGEGDCQEKHLSDLANEGVGKKSITKVKENHKACKLVVCLQQAIGWNRRKKLSKSIPNG